MSQKIKLKITTPERIVFEQEIEQITLPVLGGQVTILPGHRSYIAALKAGEIMLKQDGKEIILATSGGFLEFNANNLVILADTAENASEIDLARAEQARNLAEISMKENISMDELEYAKVAASIEKENARVRVARKHHTKHEIKID